MGARSPDNRDAPARGTPPGCLPRDSKKSFSVCGQYFTHTYKPVSYPGLTLESHLIDIMTGIYYGPFARYLQDA